MEHDAQEECAWISVRSRETERRKSFPLLKMFKPFEETREEKSSSESQIRLKGWRKLKSALERKYGVNLGDSFCLCQRRRRPPPPPPPRDHFGATPNELGAEKSAGEREDRESRKL